MPQTYRTNCPQCTHKAKYQEQLAGRSVKCKKCGTSFRLPEIGAGSTDSEAPDPLSDLDLPDVPSPPQQPATAPDPVWWPQGSTGHPQQTTAPAPGPNWDDVPVPPQAPSDRGTAQRGGRSGGGSELQPHPGTTRVISRIPGSETTPSEEDEDAPTVDRSYSFRRRIEEYFIADIEAPIRMISMVIPVIVGGFISGFFSCGLTILPAILGGMLLFVGGIGLLIYQLITTSTDEEVAVCIRNDRKALRQAALRRVRRHTQVSASTAGGGVLPGWGTPLVFVGPAFVDEEDEIYGAQMRVGHDGAFRCARSNVMVIVLGQYQIVTYTIGINHRNGRVYSDSLNEYFYQDVVASVSGTRVILYAKELAAYWSHRPRLRFLAQKLLEPPKRGHLLWRFTRMFNPLWLGLTLFSFLVRKYRSEVVIEEFSLHSAGTTSSDVTLAFHYVDNAADDQGALIREDSAEEEAVRGRIREVKTLLRREL